MNIRYITSVSAALALTSAVHAGTTLPTAPLPPAPAPSDWWFRAAPYAWVPAMTGDVGIGPLSTPVDISMSDVISTVDMTFMGIFEVGKGDFSLGVDVLYSKNSQDIEAGNHIFDSFRFEQKQWMLTPYLAYQLIDAERYHMSIYAGARFTILEAELTGRFVGEGQLNGSSDIDWADPIIGIRGQADLSDKWFFRYSGDIGGFGVNSDLTWQAFAGFGYKITPNVSTAIGYRGLGIDYSKDAFSMDVVSHGPVIGLEIRF
jgi:opacity protein-like surface antigen